MEDIIKVWNSQNRSFTVERRGSQVKIYIGNKKVNYKSAHTKGMEGVHIVNMVKKEIINRINKGEYLFDTSTQKPKPFYYSFYNPEGIEKALKQNADLISVDINGCYWNTLFMLGAIGEDVYYRGSYDRHGESKKEWKAAKNASIGALASITTIEKYANGKLVSSKIQENPYRFINWQVVNTVYSLAEHIAKNITVLYYLTDCFIIRVNEMKLCKDLIEESGYEWKCKLISNLSIEQELNCQKVSWKESDDEKIKYYLFNKSQSFESINKKVGQLPPT